MAKDKKSEKKAGASKVKEVKKPATAVKIPTSKEILNKAKKAVSIFNFF
jgi:hypothetical protein